MDDNTTTAIYKDQICLFFGGSPQTLQEMHPFPLSSSSYRHPLEMGDGEDSGAGSEEGLEVSEEPVKAVPLRSGSKRSRAAEVHNLSEKRRRSRINEKMKALQNLIPNSNKTDKASMLDEAIEYLKQLQLQVQMLSMRNRPISHPMYIPGSLHPLQASQLCMNFGDNTSTMNLGELGVLNLNQDSTMNNSFDLTNRCTSSHRSVMLPTGGTSPPESSFVLESSQPRHATFHVGVPGQETFAAEMVSHQPLDSSGTTANLSEIVMKTVEVARSLHFGVQPLSSLDHNDHLASVLSKDHLDNNPIFVQNFDELQASRGFTKDDAHVVKSEAQGM